MFSREWFTIVVLSGWHFYLLVCWPAETGLCYGRWGFWQWMAYTAAVLGGTVLHSLALIYFDWQRLKRVERLQERRLGK